MRQVEQFSPGIIALLPDRRAINEDAVERLSESMRLMGLRTPITVRIVDGFVDADGVVVDGQPVLVTGAHRLAAAKKLGWEKIECFVFDGDDEIDAQLWEIAENLHRAELSTLERSEQIAEWVRLMDEKARQTAQVAQAVLTDGRKAGPQHQPSGISAAARDLGIDRDKARRAVKIASISDDAKARAVEYGIDTQSALERIARAEDQLAEVEQIEDERVEREKSKEVRRVEPKQPEHQAQESSFDDVNESELRKLMALWNRCRESVKQEFVTRNRETIMSLIK